MQEQHLKLSKLQKEILVGILLGDACLETQNKGRTYRLLIEQSEAHQSYVDHLYSIFSDWVGTPPKFYTRANGRTCKKLKTLSHSSFRFYGQQWYENLPSGKRRKKLPKLIHRWFTPRVLAYWWMDDGSIKSYQSYGVILNTQNFYLNEVCTLCEILKQQFDFDAKPRKQINKRYKTTYYQIYISGKSFPRFIEYILPYIVDCMRYKLPPPYLKSLK